MTKVTQFIVFALLIALMPVAAIAVHGSDSGNSSDSGTSSSSDSDSDSTSTQNQGYNFSDDKEIRTEVKTRVLESNPEVGTMTMEQVRELVKEEAREMVQDKIQATKPEYAPTNETSKTRCDTVSGAIEEVVVLSSVIESEVLGVQLENSANGFSTSEDRANEALDVADQRSAIAKFFIGPNYNQLKEVKAQMEQNQVRVANMNQVCSQVENAGDQTEIKAQVKILEDQNTALQSQVDEEEAGFSLLGWLIRLITGY